MIINKPKTIEERVEEAKEHIWGNVCKCGGGGTSDGSKTCKDCGGSGIIDWDLTYFTKTLQAHEEQVREEDIEKVRNTNIVISGQDSDIEEYAADKMKDIIIQSLKSLIITRIVWNEK